MSDPAILACPSCGAPSNPPLSRLLKSQFRCDDCHRVYQRDHKRRARGTAPGKEREWKRWTPEEDALLHDGVRDLPGRTPSACYERARIIGAVHPDKYRNADIAFIKRHYRTKTHKWIGEQIGRTEGAVSHYTAKHGLLGGQKSRGGKRHRLSERQRERVPAEVQAAVPRTIPKHIRDEIVNMMVLDALERRLAFKTIKGAFKTYWTRYYKLHPDKGAHASLDARIFEDGHTTLGETISSEAFRF
jgi:hypothetical protein